MLPNLSGLARDPKCLPCNDPYPQPPDWKLPGVSDPALPENLGKPPEELGNVCSICLAPLAGPAEGNEELPDELERVRSSQHQYHRWCLAKWAWNHDTDPQTRDRLQPGEIEGLLAFRPRPVDEGGDVGILLGDGDDDDDHLRLAEQTTDRFQRAYDDDDVNAIQEMVDRGDLGSGSGIPDEDFLTEAIANSNLRMVRVLIAAGVNVDGSDANEGVSPLIGAITNEQSMIALLLIRAGANLESGGSGGTAFWWAAHNGMTDVVYALIAAGADLDVTSGTENVRMTALMSASAHGNLETMKTLIDAGADIDAAPRPLRATALMVAVTSDMLSDTGIRRRAVEMLIAAGANVNLSDRRAESALTLAEARGYTDTAQALRDAGARG
jgi:uncharacterized protein